MNRVDAVLIHAMVSVTLLVPFLFHFVVVYFLRPSAKIVSVVVSVPGRIGRAFSTSSKSSTSLGLTLVSPCIAGRDGAAGSGSYSFSGNLIVIRPAMSAVNDAMMANPPPHHILALVGSLPSAEEARKISVSIAKTLPEINNQPHPRNKTISKYAHDAIRSASTPAKILMFAMMANVLAAFIGPSKNSFF